MATNIIPRRRIVGQADDLNADQDARVPGADSAGAKWDENGMKMTISSGGLRSFARYGRRQGAPGQRNRRGALE
jgi:hypothetical protein